MYQDHLTLIPFSSQTVSEAGGFIAFLALAFVSLATDISGDIINEGDKGIKEASPFGCSLLRFRGGRPTTHLSIVCVLFAVRHPVLLLFLNGEHVVGDPAHLAIGKLDAEQSHSV